MAKRPLLLFLLFILLLASRRWQQLFSPQVWDEDGTRILPALVHDGLRSFTEPVNGYLISLPKVISAISLHISFLYYPYISTALTFALTGLVGLAIAYSPSKLRGRLLCAFSVFLLPIWPETYGIPLYTFWWASILLLLLTLWDENDNHAYLRILFLAVGGLSSPVIILVLPVLMFRAAKYRKFPREIWLALIASLFALIQMFFIVRGEASHLPSLRSLAENTLPAFFGGFLLGQWVGNKEQAYQVFGLLAASGVLIYLISSYAIFRRRHAETWILLYLLAGSIALSVARVDPGALFPRADGARYFFFPYILLFWILIQCLKFPEKLNADRDERLQVDVSVDNFRASNSIAAKYVLSFAVLNGISTWSHAHADLDWAGHVRSCSSFTDYSIPIQFDGKNAVVWYWTGIKGSTCAGLLGKSGADSALPVYAYRIVPDIGQLTMNNPPELTSATIHGADPDKSTFPGLKVIGSFQSSDADTGAVVLKMHKGSQLLYRSAARRGGEQYMQIVGMEKTFIATLPGADSWVKLDFSNSRLPDAFSVRIVDAGTGRGQWFAIAY